MEVTQEEKQVIEALREALTALPNNLWISIDADYDDELDDDDSVRIIVWKKDTNYSSVGISEIKLNQDVY